MKSFRPRRDIGIIEILRGALLIAGTAIGAGMLGMPLLTGVSGFGPAFAVTTAVWLFMLFTGLCLLEVCLCLPEGANYLTLARHFLGERFRVPVAGCFIFLYCCLLVAYFSGIGPMLAAGLAPLLGGGVPVFVLLLGLAALFGVVLMRGAHSVSRINSWLSVGMFLCFFALTLLWVPQVKEENLEHSDWSLTLLATPVLFSAFGYHNIVPSLCTLLRRDRMALRQSIILGTVLAYALFMVWQWVIIGTVPLAAMQEGLAANLPVTEIVGNHTGISSIAILYAKGFAFFAITTSLLGVSLSLVDFYSDSFKIPSKGMSRLGLVLMTLVPPLLFAIVYPHVFISALGVAGGIGEALLNGIIPVAMVWMARYVYKAGIMRGVKPQLGGGHMMLLTLLALGCLVFGVEVWILFF